MIAEKVYKVIDILDEISNIESKLSNTVSQCDMKVQDLLHYLENSHLKVGGYIKLLVELKKVRIERRQAKNDLNIMNEFKKNMLQIQSPKGRETLKNIIKRQEKINNGKYHNRVYKPDELDLIVGVKKFDKEGSEKIDNSKSR